MLREFNRNRTAHIKWLVDRPRDMDRKEIVKTFRQIVCDDCLVGLHAAPSRLKQRILSDGIVQGSKTVDRGVNLPGIHFVCIGGRDARWYVRNMKTGKLINKARATIANVVHVAMRRGDRHFTVFLFDAERAMEMNGKSEVKLRTRAFPEIRLVQDDGHKPVIPPEMLMHFDFGEREEALVRERAIELKGRLRPGDGMSVGPKHFTSYLKFERTDFVMCRVLQAVENGGLPIIG